MEVMGEVIIDILIEDMEWEDRDVWEDEESEWEDQDFTKVTITILDFTEEEEDFMAEGIMEVEGIVTIDKRHYSFTKFMTFILIIILSFVVYSKVLFTVSGNQTFPQAAC